MNMATDNASDAAPLVIELTPSTLWSQPYLLLVVVATASALFWRILQSVIQTVLRRCWRPVEYQMSSYKKWRVSNELTSLGHATVSGVWALVSCILFPKLLTDMVFYHHTAPVDLLMMTTGYLLHDSLDMVINEWSFRTLELLFHHGVVLIGVFTAIIGERYLGVVVFGLLIELNSVNLHVRSLLNHFKISRASALYVSVSRVNLVTLIVFRLGPSLYMAVWLALNVRGMEWYFALPSTFVILSLGLVNVTLSYRLLLSDGFIGGVADGNVLADHQLAARNNSDNNEGGEEDEAADKRSLDQHAIILA